MAVDFQLHRNPSGQLVFSSPEKGEHVNVEPVRAFPITAPGDGISLLNREGHELAWIPNLDGLDGKTRILVEEELCCREFMPEIQRVCGVSGYATPCTWRVETDRGDTHFILKTEDDIRRMTAPTLLIVDSRGIQFLIRDPGALDEASRRILERFL